MHGLQPTGSNILQATKYLYGCLDFCTKQRLIKNIQVFNENSNLFRILILLFFLVPEGNKPLVRQTDNAETGVRGCIPLRRKPQPPS